MTRNPTLPELLNDTRDSALDDLYVSVPSRVVSYDSATQKASLQPLIKVRHNDENGVPIVENLPIVNAVPVMFPGGGGFTVTFPISVGDTMLLVFSGVSLDKWLKSGGSGSVDPETYSRHALTDAIAIPGLRSFADKRQSVPTDHVRIGVDGESVQGVALGSTLKDYLDNLRSYIETSVSGIRDKFNNHTHTTSCGAGAGSTAGPVAAFAWGASPAVPDVESDSVKVTE